MHSLFFLLGLIAQKNLENADLEKMFDIIEQWITEITYIKRMSYSHTTKRLQIWLLMWP